MLLRVGNPILKRVSTTSFKSCLAVGSLSARYTTSVYPNNCGNETSSWTIKLYCPLLRTGTHPKKPVWLSMYTNATIVPTCSSSRSDIDFVYAKSKEMQGTEEAVV